eukprot:TRINITY_DN8428_c0_g2_i1.p1 TRINITY_DN8428_c0_g2~~TRINITY_DN8428_c0_g2_i1.p1  ORF type:complete len:392 (+),score=72.83 TRINITY_DN8428_c0_g2_i1:49-1224(+)
MSVHSHPSLRRRSNGHARILFVLVGLMIVSALHGNPPDKKNAKGRVDGRPAADKKAAKPKNDRPAGKLSGCPTPVDLSKVAVHPVANHITQFARDPSQCYCELWSNFLDHLDEYRGEEGENTAMLAFKNVREDFDKMNINIYAILAATTAYGLDLMKVVNDRIYIDIGSGVGTTASFYNSMQPRGMRFYFFEPNTTKHGELGKALQPLSSRATIVPLALAETAGEMSLDHPAFHSFADNFIRPQQPIGNIISALSLDQWLQKNNLHQNPIPIMHIDVNGNEMSVLRGARKALSYTRVIFFGCHAFMKSGMTQGAGSNHNELQEFLAEFGFLAFKLSKTHWIPFTAYWYHPAMDVTENMGWQKCMAVRHDDPILDITMYRYLPVKWCHGKKH